MARRQSDQFHTPPKYNPSPKPTAQLSAEATGDASSSLTASPREGKRTFWQWQLIWLSLLVGFGVTGAAAFLWLLTMPPPPNCQQLSPLAADGERLYCAQQAAKSGKLEQLESAIGLVQAWPKEHPLYSQGQHLIGEWSKAMLAFARAKIELGDLKGALAIVAKIPKTSPSYPEVQDAVTAWEKNWQEGQKLYDTALAALKSEDLRKAWDYAQALFKLENIFWSQKRYNELIQQISLERNGWQRLQEARNLAQEGTPQKFAEAIVLARKIDPQLFARGKAEKEIEGWSRTLLAMATKRLKGKDLPGAIEAASVVPQDSPLFAEAQDLMQLGRAQAVMWNQSVSTPLAQHIFTLLEGQGAASQIAPGRPLYKQAQVQVESLQVQFQDLLRLQVASTIASFGQIGALQMAIEQAQTIGPRQPRRVHAQTLVATWRREIQRIEDQAFVNLAKQLVAPGTVEGLKGGIAQVLLISQNRPRRVEAQTLLAQWTKRIEVIQDQPFLDEAIALAKQGKLSAAIDKASEIKSGRSLYAKAQDNVYQWVSELQVAQDRPILDRAAELASQGSLSAAINMASQVGYGRALHSEAAGAIGRWSAELRANTAPPPEPAREYAPAPQQEEYAPAPQQEEYAPAPRQEEYAPAPEPYYPPAREEAPAPAPEPYYPPARQEAPAPAPEPYYPPAREPEPYYPPAREPEPYYPPARQEAPAPAPEPARPPAPAPEPAPSIPQPAGPPDANLIPE
ncbi:MAG: hypothetical protein JGK24_24235 [Microcoleus sp. PH2017_29_MFU_D_A]|nr:hypothetical protein [Microcoleus sp. PH2017_37_MFU_D_B]MCC3512337.1 hypothetical protein [Microcoleus sp. PH2017_17_BER_D_A]MCC3588934.1 hypothetical protein [Microcoleus sp. PH2017_30_WIL_O_A]MCC3606249.1 hypothetical protein [Microcoleus sp. PH2017_29_MFU_D_A]MCC3637289.1 hypothetical protein [Microcoleus sp. PH2017_37_MFU_D_B]